MKYCPKCNSEYENNINFCQKCGTELESKIELKNCPSCNAENPESAKFCNECGEKFTSIIYRCSNKSCGKIYETYNSENCFCSKCGGKIEEYQEQSFQAENINLKEQLKELENKIEELNCHNNSLKKANENQKNELGNEISKLQEQVKEITNEKKSLHQELDSTKAELQKYKDKEEQELLKKQQNVKKQKIANEEDFVLLDKYKTPFYISKYQVTQELYEKVMEQNPSQFAGKDLPVESVSWYDAIYFCNLLSEMEGLEPVYKINGKTDVKQWDYTRHNGESIEGHIEQNVKASGYRLPTEDEWQYAARGGKNYKYSGSSNNLDPVGWYAGNSGKKTHPVGQKKANDYGLYDMTGNVWERCWDWYDNSNRVTRGGSWRSYDGNCAVSVRGSSSPSSCDNNDGFRLVRSSSN